MIGRTLNHLKPSNFNEATKLLTIIGAFISFTWTVWTWRSTTLKEFNKLQIETERYENIRRIEASKPFLERQLKLYTELTQITSIIATSDNNTKLQEAKKRFWELYWGELALVENEEIEGYMVSFGNGINNSFDQELMQKISLELAHSCGRSLNHSWGIDVWNSR